MLPPEPTPPPPLAPRLRRFGQGALAVVLMGIGVLWVHELCSEPTAPKGWKLLLLLPMLLLGAGGTVALVVAAALEWRAPTRAR